MNSPVGRIKVSTDTRVRVHDVEKPVVVLGVSAGDALLFAHEPLGAPGDIVSLFLPGIGVPEIQITAGIARSDRVQTGHAFVVDFIIVEKTVRAAVNELLRLLLAGDGGGARRHPRIIYDVPVRYGPTGRLAGRLEEISLSGLSVRVSERLAPGTVIEVVVPNYSSSSNLSLRGEVVEQRLATEDGYHTGVAFVALESSPREQLSRLLADLLCR